MNSKIVTFIVLIFICVFSNIYSQTHITNVILIDGYPSKILKNRIETNAKTLLTEFEKAFITKEDSIKFTSSYLSEKAKKNINSIWSSTKFHCIKNEIKEQLIKTSSGYELRNIPVIIEDQSQEIALELDNDGVIIDLYFSVSMHQYKNIINNNKVIDETRNNIIRDFIESLKTAYMKKDIEFINMVLSDKALIVVGKTIKPTEQASLKVMDTSKKTLYDSGSNSSYKKLTKEEYINGLKRVFKVNKKIFIDFNDIEIIPHRKSGFESFYGVRLKQNWQSDNYSDYGILFFVIQFRENDNPLIWVRVWQDAKTTPDSAQIGLGEILIQPK